MPPARKQKPDPLSAHDRPTPGLHHLKTRPLSRQASHITGLERISGLLLIPILMSNQDTNAAQWKRLSRKVSTKINLAWWLDKLAVPLLVSALAGSCLILITRRETAEFPWLQTVIIGLLLLLGMGLMAWWLARGNFESPDHALVRMEASMKMCNTLSAARQGLTPWPSIPGSIDDGTRWKWTRLLSPLLAAALFLATSIFLPVSAGNNTDELPPDEPQAWKDLQADIEALGEDQTAQEDYLDELEERVDQLRSQNEQEWYSHSSLEATDALRKMHGSELERMEQNLRKAERSLKNLQQDEGKMGEVARQRMLTEFEEALQALNEGKMKPNQELLNQLKKLDPEDLGQIDQEQFNQLCENMRQHAENCQQCNGGGQQGQGALADSLDDLLNGGTGNDDLQKEAPGGTGGINRGPGSAPGVLGQASPDVDSGDLEGLDSGDLSKSLPGDLLKIQDGEHEVDKSKTGLRAGGNVESEAKGGSRVWKESLLPSEKSALKDFFK